MSLMGAILPEMDRGAASRDVRYPGYEQAAPPRGQHASGSRSLTRFKDAAANGRIDCIDLGLLRVLSHMCGCQIIKFRSAGKNRLRWRPICRIGRALHAKTSQHHHFNLRMRDVLSLSDTGPRILSAASEVCLHRCLWKKAVCANC